jgi:hypothetical protein
MKEIQIFKNELFGNIRTMTNEKGETYFVGKDVAEALGYSDPQKALKMHVDNEDKLTRQIVVSGQRRNIIFINESGLYALVLSSKLPTAKQFKRWVTAEVLPQIRKTGGYIPTNDGKELPVKISSGFRSKMLNRAVGGVNDSNHLDGCAADIVCKDCKQALEYAFILNLLFQRANQEFDELFIERKGVRFWVHFAVREFNNRGKCSVYDG